MSPSCPNSIPKEIWQRLAYYRRTTRVVEHLRLHPDEPLTLAKAAAIACMERTAFSRFFSKRIGVTFSEFLRWYRVEVAKHEMLQRNSSLKEVARSVGFGCMATFERQFRKETGKSPSKFRAAALAGRGLLPKSPPGFAPTARTGSARE